MSDAPAVEKINAKNEKDVASDGRKKTVLFLYKKQCNGCGYLVAHRDKFYKECHYTTGNVSCPASAVYITVGINFERLARRVAQAIEEGNIKLRRKLESKLDGKDSVVEEKYSICLKQELIKRGLTASEVAVPTASGIPADPAVVEEAEVPAKKTVATSDKKRTAKSKSKKKAAKVKETLVAKPAGQKVYPSKNEEDDKD